MTQDQILQEIENMMNIVKKEKESLEKILATLEANSEGKSGSREKTDLKNTQ
jgi:hypothetical protein